MKKNFKFIFIFVVMIVSIIVIRPLEVNAISQKTSYISINDTKKIDVGDLSFTDIVFKDYSMTSLSAFGLSGNVSNKSSHIITYHTIAYFYDKDYKVLGQSDDLIAMAIIGSCKFNQMSPTSILNSHEIKEVAYYSLSINYDEKNILTESSLTPSKNFNYLSYDYVIDKYNIDITVNENNSFNIEEDITAYFNNPKHGIVKAIPLKNTFTRQDNTTIVNRAKVDDISINNEYTSKRESESLKLQIGSASKTITGEENYIIKYHYSLGNDTVKDYDELYINIIGTEWDTVIGNITFSILMPKDFDSSKLVISSGSSTNNKVKYAISDNKIIGSYEGILDKNEGITIRCELPEGYFIEEKVNINILDCLIFIIPIVLLIIFINLRHKFCKKINNR